MDKNKKTSGASKRKLRKEKEEKIKKWPKLHDFVLTSKNEKSRNKTDITITDPCANERYVDPQDEQLIHINLEQINKKDDLQPQPSVSSNEDNIQLQPSTSKESNYEFSELNVLQKIVDEGQTSNSDVVFSTDLGYYIGKTITEDIKRFVINSAPCRPIGPFPKDPVQNNRSFSESYYTTTSKYGPISRAWLCYSPILDAAYCQPCWLFSSVNSDWGNRGIRTWQHLSWKIITHGNTAAHVQSCKILELWKKNQTIDKDLEDRIRYEASFWKMVLDRLFSITLMLACHYLS